jgi:hypothetical protein
LRIGHHRSRIFQRRLVTKHHGAQTQARNFQGAFAQGGGFHLGFQIKNGGGSRLS